MIESLALRDDGPDGMMLFLDGDDLEFVHNGCIVYRSHDRQHFPISREALLDFLRSREAQAVLDHADEGERERALYDAATPEERIEVITGERYGTAEEVEAELYRDRADIDRKREKGE